MRSPANSRRLALLALAVVAVAAFFALGLHELISREALLERKADLENLRRAYPLLSIALFMFVYAAAGALSLPVGTVLTLTAGAVFGFWPALAMVAIASAIGATLAFLAARFVLRDWVQARFGERLQPINAEIERNGAVYLFALRLTPLVPYWLVNLALGLSPMRTWTFYWVSQLGVLALTAVIVYAGVQLGEFRPSAGLLIALLVLGVIPIAVKAALGTLRARSA